jgi:hypothetical protein
MCRDGHPVDDFCMDLSDTARPAAPAIRQHHLDKALTNGHELPGRERTQLGGSHVHHR